MLFYFLNQEFAIIKNADPLTTKVLQPKRDCWNCGYSYFADAKNVYYGAEKIKGADTKTFHLVNHEYVDAADKRNNYFEGRITDAK